ncbi:MAG: hypothetical protein H8E27_01210 [Verrucomicrobia subdivision 3 bacterium]|nr:hypothetical protein [Limisphaerales bacterium]
MKHLITALAACAITASAQITLEIKHTENSTFTSQHNVKLIQILKIAGQEIPTKSLQKFTVKSTTNKRAANGTLNTLATFTQWEGQWNFPGGIKMEFSTATPDAKAPLAQLEPILDIVRTMVKHPTTQIYNKDGSLNKVTIPKAALDGLEGPLKNEFNAKQISEGIKQEHARLPNKAVSKGDTWVRKETMPLGAGQTLNFRVDYTYEGIIEKNNHNLDRITEKVTDAAYDMNGPNAGPLTVKDSDLKAAKSKIELLFDRKLGRFVETKSLIQVTGEMTFKANGQELPGKLDLTIEQNTAELPSKKK